MTAPASLSEAIKQGSEQSKQAFGAFFVKPPSKLITCQIYGNNIDGIVFTAPLAGPVWLSHISIRGPMNGMVVVHHFDQNGDIKNRCHLGYKQRKKGNYNGAWHPVSIKVEEYDSVTVKFIGVASITATKPTVILLRYEL